MSSTVQTQPPQSHVFVEANSTIDDVLGQLDRETQRLHRLADATVGPQPADPKPETAEVRTSCLNSNLRELGNAVGNLRRAVDRFFA